MGKCKGMEGFGMSGTLNHDEIEIIYLSFVNDYKLCKRKKKRIMKIITAEEDNKDYIKGREEQGIGDY